MKLIEVEKGNVRDYEITLNNADDAFIREHEIEPDSALSPINDMGFAQGISNNRSTGWQTSGSESEKSGVREKSMGMAKLIAKLENFFDLSEKKQRKKHHKLARLQHLLSEKIVRYEARLEEDLEPEKRSKLETRLKVVKLQLQKSIDLSVLK